MHTSIPDKTASTLRFLCLGDVVGKAGCEIVQKFVSVAKKTLQIDLVLANGENCAESGLGLTPSAFRKLTQAGVDIVTTGNHVWDRKESYTLLQEKNNLLRPANYVAGTPGKGVTTFIYKDVTVACINLVGRVFMGSAACPFITADTVLDSLPDDISCILVDMHADATSEKRALCHYLDGRVSAVLGTHTHVQTSDAKISDKGTATITDLGMCGVEHSVLGMAVKPIISKFTTGIPHYFRPAKGAGIINGILLDIDAKTGKAQQICIVRHDMPHSLDSNRFLLNI